jgi:hypothetical protein
MPYSNYRSDIRAYVRGFWAGHLTYDQAFESLLYATERGLRQAWYEGAQEVGVEPSELTPSEISALRALIISEQQYIGGLLADIEANSKANGGKLTPLLSRADMWANRWHDARSKAMLIARDDQKLRWDLGPTEQHCDDCANYNGRVYRASIWRKYGVQPQSRSLSCRGYRCLCVLTPTTEPGTPGHPPRPRYG